MFNFGKTDRSVGFTNGCYDILHIGHLKLFEYLKSNCNRVIIGIDSDRRVKETKGSDRPFNNEKDRQFMLQSLKFIDEVVIFDSEDELEDLVKIVKPNLMVVGSDYKNRRVIGAEHAEKLEFFERIDGYSTTNILQNRSNWW